MNYVGKLHLNYKKMCIKLIFVKSEQKFGQG